jgi:hypothetical protein
MTKSDQHREKMKLRRKKQEEKNRIQQAETNLSRLAEMKKNYEMNKDFMRKDNARLYSFLDGIVEMEFEADKALENYNYENDVRNILRRSKSNFSF